MAALMIEREGLVRQAPKEQSPDNLSAAGPLGRHL
jgi:hypothetical protein